MNSEPLVSICTPVFNGEDFIEDCIKGVLNQTYRLLEYIIVDNASTDETPLIIEKYRKIDPRIKVYQNEKTITKLDNFNLCARYSADNAKWIKYALADDYFFPNCIEEMIKVGESDDQIGLISAYRMAGKSGREVTNMGLPIEQNVFDGAGILKNQILRKLHVVSSSPSTVMYRKSVFCELKGFNTKLMHCDTELAFRLLDKYKLGFAHYVLTKSGRETGGGEYYSIIHGIKIKEYLEFGYKNIRHYNSVTFDGQELDYLKKYYADKIMSFFVTKLAYLEWSDIKRILINTPEDIKKELKTTFFNNFLKYIKVYFKSIFNVKNYIKYKKRIN